MLAEAKAVASLLDCALEIIHAGSENPENQQRFADAFVELQFAGPIHWREAPQPSDAIIQAVQDARIDLLIAGAMERDSEGRFFLGKVSRVLVRDAPCSILLFPNPSPEPAPFSTLAVIVDYTPASRLAMQVTLELAARSKAETVHVLRIFTVFSQVLAEPQEFMKGNDSNALAEEEARLDAFVQEFDISAIPIVTRCIEGTTGFGAADHVQDIGADLLVIASDGPSGHAHFPPRMEWLENVIPVNLLVIRPPAEETAPV